MTTKKLFLFEDTIPAHARPVYLPEGDRSVYVRSGSVEAISDTASQFLWEGSAHTSGTELTLASEDQDAVLWRWELGDTSEADDYAFRSAPETTSTLKLAADLELDDRYTWLMRCDTVTFPPSGEAFTHLHQGPGIRITREGEITIETEGAEHVHGPGDAWAEKGVVPVYASTTAESSTTFVRCFVLPKQVKGVSSLRIVRPEDRAKANTQKYRVLAERIMSWT
ncbi:hypothetical protein [Prauserella cavernicola]|uniref:Cupin domain-containing protein n=1 Tax=Prauserella cavernicola TaxID=2800127 RepID=A0A934QWK7_9PSEU|nr:hypothetical protein [Prauserella cavernicola]MBK1787950.1 hypothetical protein [Prauserella cavernicola]